MRTEYPVALPLTTCKGDRLAIKRNDNTTPQPKAPFSGSKPLETLKLINAVRRVVGFHILWLQRVEGHLLLNNEGEPSS